MTTFLNRLVERAHDTAPRVRPLVASRYDTSGSIPRGSGEPDADRAARPTPSPSAEAKPLPPREVPHEKISSAPDQFRPEASREARPRTEQEPDRPRDIAETPAPLSVRHPGRGRRVERLEVVRPPAPPARLQSIEVAEASTAPAPIVRVTIGRIEVRAPAAPVASPRPRVHANEPKLTLDAYLKSRAEGKR